MNHLIPHILNVILFRRGANVALPKPVGPHDSMEPTYHHVMSDIKFPSLVQQRFFYVFLNNISLLLTIEVFLLLLQDIIEFVYLVDHSYPLTPIRKLTRFDNPNVFYIRLTVLLFCQFFKLLAKCFILRI